MEIGRKASLFRGRRGLSRENWSGQKVVRADRFSFIKIGPTPDHFWLPNLVRVAKSGPDFINLHETSLALLSSYIWCATNRGNMHVCSKYKRTVRASVHDLHCTVPALYT